jgi:hypothetical protein
MRSVARHSRPPLSAGALSTSLHPTRRKGECPGQPVFERRGCRVPPHHVDRGRQCRRRTRLCICERIGAQPLQPHGAPALSPSVAPSPRRRTTCRRTGGRSRQPGLVASTEVRQDGLSAAARRYLWVAGRPTADVSQMLDASGGRSVGGCGDPPSPAAFGQERPSVYDVIDSEP